MRSKRRVTALVAVLSTASLLTVFHAQADPSATEGSWSAPFSEGGFFDSAPPSTKAESAQNPTAVSSVVMPNGKVLFWNGLAGSEGLDKPLTLSGDHTFPNSASRVLDLKTMTFATPVTADGGAGDLFCADQRSLADGRVIAVGGTEWTTAETVPGPGRTELLGLKSTRVFDPSTGDWTVPANGQMHFRRWYPSLVTLPDSKILVAGGVEKLVYNDKGLNVAETETFDPTSLEWTQNPATASTSLPLFARLRLLPNGKVFYDGTGQMWGPAGEAVDEALWNMQKSYDPATQTWTDNGLAPLGARSGSFSVMLPLRPDLNGNYSKAEIIVAGGVLGTSPGTYLANDITEKITIDGETVTRSTVANLNNRRWYSSGVVLPTGQVLAVNGADKDEVIMPGTEFAIRQPELYDPATDTWTRLASGARDRTYHNTAVLLPDGRVLVGGHSPIPAFYGAGNANYFGPPFANNFKDPSFEIYSPPYLHNGVSRPVLSYSPRGLAWGTSATLTVPNAADVTQVVLSRLPAATHITDADQRTVQIPITGSTAGSLAVSIPSSTSALPAGTYYLFLIKGTGAAATPSKAAIVTIGSTSDATAALTPAVLGS
ncbi:MAG: galactose oxidase-like domain-containing protein [Actinomycetota bacterium]